MRFVLPVVFWCASLAALAQTSLTDRYLKNADTLCPSRVWALSGVTGVGYGGVVTVLSQYWYANYPQEGFHFFNDNNEWLQMDKGGHVFTCYFESELMANAYTWAGVPRRKAAFIGAGLGFAAQLTVEIMDGFSSEWGFSPGDLTGNTVGAGLFLGQELLWGEQRLRVKYSAHPEPYPQASITSTNGQAQTTYYNRSTDLFGHGNFERTLKDYNGATFWVSANIASFLPNRETTNFPKWLNVAVGYGASGMYGGEQNTWRDKNGNNYDLRATTTRYREFYLAPDIDWTRIPTHSPTLRALFKALNIIKVPAPTLEYNQLGQFRGHWLFF